MKATQKQKIACDVLRDVLGWIISSNDIQSPTLISDFEEEIAKYWHDDRINQYEMNVILLIGYDLIENIRDMDKT